MQCGTSQTSQVRLIIFIIESCQLSFVIIEHWKYFICSESDETNFIEKGNMEAFCDTFHSVKYQKTK